MKGFTMVHGIISRYIVPSLVFFSILGYASPPKEWVDPMDETPEQRAERMEWWHEAKFGMFIHWGVYAVPAGTYKDEQLTGGLGEWIMHRGKIPVAEYKAYAAEFNPVKYDPDAWVRLAKAAGMKYIVITAKHHDGFALFDSKVTDWDVVDATPYGKDLLRPLEAACKKHGIRLGFYYSQAQDWTHPGGAKKKMKEGEGWDEAHKGDFDQYLKEIAYPQVEEILSQYDIDVLWWDTPTWMTTERADLLRPLLKLRPGLITNNRLGGDYKGDMSTPEQMVPATGLDFDWESCMTMNDTWGYKSYDDNWKSTETLIRNLIDIASKGGNFLLNVGPTALGEFPEASIDRLEAVGKWMDVNSEAIYGSSASPFRKLQWGRCTQKGGKLYLHVFEWPEDGRLMVPGLGNEIVKASLLVDGTELSVSRNEQGWAIRLPDTMADPIATVIEVVIKGPVNVDPLYPSNAPDGSILLGPAMADMEQHGYGAIMKIAREQGGEYIANWKADRASLSWQFKNIRTGTYKVVAEIRVDQLKGKNMVLELRLDDGKKMDGSISDVQVDQWSEVALGQVEIPEGVRTLQFKRRKKNNPKSDLNIRKVRLVPVP
jgi:alpha-L-fucosidase